MRNFTLRVVGAHTMLLAIQGFWIRTICPSLLCWGVESSAANAALEWFRYCKLPHHLKVTTDPFPLRSSSSSSEKPTNIKLASSTRRLRAQKLAHLQGSRCSLTLSTFRSQILPLLMSQPPQLYSRCCLRFKQLRFPCPGGCCSFLLRGGGVDNLTAISLAEDTSFTLPLSLPRFVLQM